MVDFHRRENFLLIAHSPKHLKQLEQLIATIGRCPAGELKTLYMAGFMEAMAVKATPARHAKVLRSLAVGLKGHLTAPEHARVVGLIAQYRSGLIPLVVPLTLLAYFSELHDVPSFVGQTYLHPHPGELMLRNHV